MNRQQKTEETFAENSSFLLRERDPPDYSGTVGRPTHSTLLSRCFIPLKMLISTPTVNLFPAFLSATSGGLSVHASRAVSLSLRVEGHLPYLSSTDKVLDKTGEHC